jgi:hypothetical protein
MRHKEVDTAWILRLVRAGWRFRAVCGIAGSDCSAIAAISIASHRQRVKVKRDRKIHVAPRHFDQPCRLALGDLISQNRHQLHYGILILRSSSSSSSSSSSFSCPTPIPHGKHVTHFPIHLHARKSSTAGTLSHNPIAAPGRSCNASCREVAEKSLSGGRRRGGFKK